MIGKDKATLALDFTAADSEGRTIRLADYKGRGTSSWCSTEALPDPTAGGMAQLRQDYQKFVDRETEIIAIGPEGPEAFADWWHKHEMPFIGIGDPQHVIAKLFGQQVKLLKLGRMPAQFVIDGEGRIRNLHYGESMSDIITDEEVLTVLDEINREQAK